MKQSILKRKRQFNLRPAGVAFGFSWCSCKVLSRQQGPGQPKQALERPTWSVTFSESGLLMAVSNNHHSWTGKEMAPWMARLTLPLLDHLSFSQAEACGMSITGGHRTWSEAGYNLCKSRGTVVFPAQPAWPFRGPL